MTDASLATSPWFVLVSSLLSGAVAIIVSTVLTTVYSQRAERRRLKVDCLRRLLGARYVLTPGQHSDGATETMFTALNEAIVIFADAPTVVELLQALLADLADEQKFLDNIVRLFRAMADHLGLDRSKLNDSFFLKPFKPQR